MVLSFFRKDLFLFKKVARLGEDHLIQSRSEMISGLVLVFIDLVYFGLLLFLVFVLHCYQLKSWGVYWPWSSTFVFPNTMRLQTVLHF